MYLLCLLNNYYAREGRLLEENQEAQANHTLLSLEHFGTFFKVLIDCGPFIYWLYRYLISTEWNY